ncbi:methyltransferase [Gordonia sp. QH-12]|nr:methyltransferase [Gordonia sp. QH-12]
MSTTASRAESVSRQRPLGVRSAVTDSLLITSDVSALHRVQDVYRPQEDTALLVDELTSADLSGLRVLDLCTGSGAVAVAAALAGAQVTAVDSCRHAVARTRRSAADAGVEVRTVCADLADVSETGFDVITCNPPYVPTPPGTEMSAVGPRHAWNGGPDGRAVLDVVCAIVPGLLADGGTVLIVQSELSGVDATVAALRAAGLRTEVTSERRIPFGPVVRSRHDALVESGFLDPESDDEAIVVIRAQRTGDRPGRAESA